MPSYLPFRVSLNAAAAEALSWVKATATKQMHRMVLAPKDSFLPPKDHFPCIPPIVTESEALFGLPDFSSMASSSPSPSARTSFEDGHSDMLSESTHDGNTFPSIRCSPESSPSSEAQFQDEYSSGPKASSLSAHLSSENVNDVEDSFRSMFHHLALLEAYESPASSSVSANVESTKKTAPPPRADKVSLTSIPKNDDLNLKVLTQTQRTSPICQKSTLRSVFEDESDDEQLEQPLSNKVLPRVLNRHRSTIHRTGNQSPRFRLSKLASSTSITSKNSRK